MLCGLASCACGCVWRTHVTIVVFVLALGSAFMGDKTHSKGSVESQDPVGPHNRDGYPLNYLEDNPPSNLDSSELAILLETFSIPWDKTILGSADCQRPDWRVPYKACFYDICLGSDFLYTPLSFMYFESWESAPPNCFLMGGGCLWGLFL